MVTPFDAAVGAAAFISLGVTAFQGCVKGFIILSTARQLGKDGDLLRCKLEWEHYRLFEWSRQVGLTSQNANVALNWQLVVDLLHQLDSQLNDTDKLRDRYGLVIEEDDVMDVVQDVKKESALHMLRLKVSQDFYLETSRAIHQKNKGHPIRRLRWAVIDKPKLESLLEEVRHLIQCLWDVLAFEDRRFIRDSLDRLLRNKIASDPSGSDLDAVSQLDCDSENAISSASGFKQSLISLKKDHAANLPAKKNITRAQQLKPLKLKSGLLDVNAGLSGQEREIVTYDGMTVIVEFKQLSNDPKLKEKIVFRLENLAILLNSVTHPSFHSLRCLGIVRRMNTYILVFAMPTPLGLDLGQVQCLSLEQLRKQGYQTRQDVLLLWALKIAETVLQLHTAGWLHKNIRPSSVSFIVFNRTNLLDTRGISDVIWSVSAKADLSKDDGPNNDDLGIQQSRIVGPFLSNYGSAREISPTAFSEPGFIAADDAYRHRSVQSPMKRSFRPEFDVYALGLVLLEIGLWRSLEEYLQTPLIDIPVKMGKTETIERIRSDLSLSHPQQFTEAVLMALTYRDPRGKDFLQSFGSDINEHKREENSIADDRLAAINAWDGAPALGRDSRGNEEGEDEDETDEYEDNVDVQQRIVSLLRTCL